MAAPIGSLAATMAPRLVFDRLAGSGFRFVQLDAATPGLRPRELDRSARRDLLATLRRRELTVAGVDMWIPPEHFQMAAHVDRAVAALADAVELAAELDRCPVSVVLPGDDSDCTDVVGQVAAHASRFGVTLADHGLPLGRWSAVGVGIDPAAVLEAADDPAQAILSHSRALASVRVADLLQSGGRGPLGDPDGGKLDLLSYRAAMEAAGWDQPVAADLRKARQPWMALQMAARAWRGGE